MSKKAWSGRFSKSEHPLMERFNASIPFDIRLYQEDIQGSLAHAQTLAESGILSKNELKKLQNGLEKVKKELESGDFSPNLAHEDIHMAVEARLTEIIGPLGGKLHSGRSRNDQVALDTRLFVRRQTLETCHRISALQQSLLNLADKNLNTILPGYTHLQRAQPISLAHHLLAYFEMLERDFSRFADNFERMNACPLGAGALAGSPLKLDREKTAQALGFEDITHNSLDTVSDRDFVLDFLFAASTLMMHLSRLAEELVIWNSQEFGFVNLPQEFCTGSSMMPQKVNPDAPELVRGKCGRVYGNLVALLTTMKALPLAYNKDMQEDKEPLFDSADTILMCLEVFQNMLAQTSFNTEKMRAATKDGFVLATDVADYLVQKNIPFREAHAVVGQLVQHCQKNAIGLEDLDLSTLQRFSNAFKNDVSKIMNIENSVNARQTLGGTNLALVKKELSRAKGILKKRNSP
ncbi:MAG: argininosuccinate lyase [Deltaproteobacteria bacterium]|nr:argininosuccinate lyase [Deltaproteobacteria bacterium]